MAGLAVLLAVLGFALGGLLTAVVNFGVTRLIGTPEPSGFIFDTTPANALAVPWPIFAFGAAPIGLLLGAVAATVLLVRSYRGHCRTFLARVGEEASQVAADYRDFTAKADHALDGDGSSYTKNRTAISKAWAIGRLADDAAFATALMVGGGIIVVLAAELAVALTAGPASQPGHLSNWWHGLASMVALLGVLVAGLLVTLLRQAYSAAPKRKTIGALWDVATFWPRAVHPLAPPCYAERAVPEIVDRILLLTGHEADDGSGYHAEAGRVGLSRTHGLTVPPGPVLLTGYSQGSVIAPAVIAQLPRQVRSRVALLTLACPARRLYGRAFPAYFGDSQLAGLASLLGVDTATSQPGGRWKNLYRRSDYIGSWIFAEPEFRLDNDDLRNHVDQPCWDPVILVPAANQTPPPTHRHSGWWPDPRTHELGEYLVDLLARLGRDKPTA